MKKIFLIFISQLLLMTAALAESPKLEVITTLFPTYDFAKQIGKERVHVTLLLPPGVEAHTFEPRPADMVKLNHADLFVYTGKYMEPWVAKVLAGVTPSLIVVDTSQGIELIDMVEEKAHHDHEHHDHTHEGKDPHIWLDLAHAQQMVMTLATALAQKDPKNSQFYADNAQAYTVKLAELDHRFQTMLAAAKHKRLIYGGHFAFGYFAKRYGLSHSSPYQGFSPNAEPRPKALVTLIKQLRQSGMKYIYHEELLDPKVARTIAQETGTKLELLHGAHNVSKDELQRGVTFLELMEMNFNKLKIGLESP
jgi:zinc transport system substrate-binding protein